MLATKCFHDKWYYFYGISKMYEISKCFREAYMSEKSTGSWLKWLLVGVVVGVILIAVAAQAMRFTDARPFCSSCHVMGEAALTHSQSPHANLTCNECHAPSNLVAKIPFKAKEAIKDVIGNMQGKDAPILASLETRNVVNDNCIGCHLTSNRDVSVMAAKPYCVDCHKGMAHQTKKPVSTRTVADE